MRAWGKQQEYFTQRKKVQQQMEKKRTFRKNFLQISVSMLIVILLGIGFIYETVKDVIIQQNIQLSLQAFTQVQSQFEEANRTANTIATQVMLDDVCSDFLYRASRQSMNSILLNKVRNQLSLYQNTNLTIDSIYLYNRTADCFVSSGSRLKAAGSDDFSDEEIARLIKESDGYYTQTLIPRERILGYADESENREMIYSYFLCTSREPNENVVVVNMEFDNMINEILQGEFMKDSAMLIIDEKNERLVERQTMDFEESPEIRDTVKQMVSDRKQYEEYNKNGEKYGIFCLYSGASEWNYIKVTKWETMFRILTVLQRKMIIFSAVWIMAVLLISLWNSVSIARLHGMLEMKYARITQMKKSNTHILKERFLLDFIYNRKIFSKQSLRTEMEKFGFSVSEDQKFTIVILVLENYEKYQETFGEKGTYDIKYGFYNIFEETFREHFRTMGLINRDETITFILETGDEKLSEIAEYFHKFCENVKVFVPWDFMLLGIGRAENLERIPEMNSQLMNVTAESFFYPGNTYIIYDEILKNHSRSVDFQELDTGSISKNLSAGTDAKEAYKAVSARLRECSMTDYMSAMTWLGISIVRGATKYAFTEKEGDEFLVELAKCRKASEVETLFMDLFDKIAENQSKTSVKKGVTGKLDEVKLYIEQNFRDPNTTLDKLGEEFGVSPNYLGRLFKKDAGMSVADYINAERLKWVINELETTDKPAKEIAEECGFVSTNYFYTYFRKKIGVTPQAYRENLNKTVIDDDNSSEG